MNKVEEALGLFLDSLPSNDEWWCPYCGTTGCTFNGRCDKCGTPIEENQPDTTMVESLHEALTALRSGELVASQGWQPIETAPTDKAILAYAVGVDGRPMKAIVNWMCPVHAHLSSIRNCDCIPEWIGVMGARYGVTFTHWMHLPPDPDQVVEE